MLRSSRGTREKSSERQFSLTDPVSRAKGAAARVAGGCNAQKAEDTRHTLIAKPQVHNKVWELESLAETVSAARENLDANRIHVVADKGYVKLEDIEACKDAKPTPFIPMSTCSPSGFAAISPKPAFQLDEGTDTYVCPTGQRPSPKDASKVRNMPLTHYVNYHACRTYTLR